VTFTLSQVIVITVTAITVVLGSIRVYQLHAGHVIDPTYMSAYTASITVTVAVLAFYAVSLHRRQ